MGGWEIDLDRLDTLDRFDTLGSSGWLSQFTCDDVALQDVVRSPLSSRDRFRFTAIFNFDSSNSTCFRLEGDASVPEG